MNTTTIRTTKDYDDFEMIESNRPINWKKVERMRGEIRNKNLSSAYVVIVNSKTAGKKRYNTSGTKYPVVDGQHRFMSLKLEGKKIYYLVNDNVTLDDIPRAASMQNAWKLNDYIHHYAVPPINNMKYQLFQSYMETNKFPASTTAVILLGQRSQLVIAKIKAGNMTFKRSWNRAYKFAECVKDFSKYVKFNKNARFLEAYVRVFDHPKYDHKRMMTKFEYLSDKIYRCSDAQSFLAQFEYIYNYNARDKVKFID